MASGFVNCTLRPLRLAFVVPPRRKSAVRRAIQINSFLWGGAYNPIIPFYKKAPKNAAKLWQGSTASEVFVGSIKAFDPDFIVKIDVGDLGHRELSNYNEIGAEDIMKPAVDEGIPGYGVGIFEILAHLIARDFKFVERTPTEFFIPKVDRNLFLAAMFGEIDVDLGRMLDDYSEHLPSYERGSISVSSAIQELGRNRMFPRRITHWRLNTRRTSHAQDFLLLMDEGELDDILYYWNLRASGRQVVPVAISQKDDASTLSFCQEYLSDCYWPHRNNEEFFNRAAILPAPSISESQLNSLADSLEADASLTGNDGRRKYFIQPWRPKIWSAFDRRHNGGEPAEIYLERRHISLSSQDDWFDIPQLIPEFADKYAPTAKPKCANVLDLRINDEAAAYAGVIPDGGSEVALAVNRMGFEHRCSKGAIVDFPWHSDYETTIHAPRADEVVIA